MNSMNQSTTRASLVVAVALACFVVLPNAPAVIPPPDGGYPGANTAEGQSALFSLTSGTFNTAVGWLSLESVTTGILNTAVGAGTLVLNTASENTATGAGALLSNSSGFDNTANGSFTLANNITGNNNTARSAYCGAAKGECATRTEQGSTSNGAEC
jgi:hypothetical protein